MGFLDFLDTLRGALRLPPGRHATVPVPPHQLPTVPAVIAALREAGFVHRLAPVDIMIDLEEELRRLRSEIATIERRLQRSLEDLLKNRNGG